LKESNPISHNHAWFYSQEICVTKEEQTQRNREGGQKNKKEESANALQSPFFGSLIIK